MAEFDVELSWRAAIVEVLREYGGSMHYADVADEIVARNLRTNLGATPANSVNVIISKEIKERGEQGAFIRVSRGQYMLREHYGDESQPDEDEEELDFEYAEEDEDTGIVQAFGMYWRRELVVWSGTPQLLGQQSRAAKTVDMAKQRGVYLLHDRNSVVYVGRATEQPLATRLLQHTYDRLNGRWARFSWFGLLRVTPDGQIVRDIFSQASLDLIISTLEAVLVESLEPPQNRRRGDGIRAVEYLQVEDPKLRKKELANLLRTMQERISEDLLK